MPSLADIPEDLLNKDQRIQFLAWLNSMPLPPDTRKELAQIWSEFTGEHLTKEEYKTLMPPDWE